jgi:hypothetical protein
MSIDQKGGMDQKAARAAREPVILPDVLPFVVQSTPSFMDTIKSLDGYRVCSAPGATPESFAPIHYADILITARTVGKIAPSLDSHLIDMMRSIYNDRLQPVTREEFAVVRTQPFVPRIMAMAEKETHQIEEGGQKIIDAFEEYTAKAQKIREAHDDMEAVEQALAYPRNDINRKIEAFPATAFMYFYTRGLNWVWGIDDRTTQDQVSEKTESGRLADSQNIAW